MFKLKTFLLLISLCSAAQSFAQTAATSSTMTPSKIQGVTPSGTVTGRYQLFQGSYKVRIIPSGGEVSTQGIIKLDTATGKTWLLIETADIEKKELQRVWLPLEFNYE